MARGGKRVGAGRPAKVKDGQGSRLSKQIRHRLSLTTGSTPLEFLLFIMQDTGEEVDRRMQAAIAAAPYVHPKLASVELKGNDAKPLTVESDLGKALQALAELARLREAPQIELLPSEMVTVE